MNYRNRRSKTTNALRTAFHRGYAEGRHAVRYRLTPADTTQMCPYSNYVNGVPYRIAWRAGYLAAFGIYQSEYISLRRRRMYGI